MPRKRSPQRDKAFQMWKDSNGEQKLKDIAAALGVGETQIRKWKNQDKWSLSSKVTLPKNKGNTVTKTEKVRVQPEEKCELTEKQILFVAEYLIDFNATRAAMAVGYSKKTAHSIGWENLRKPAIQAEIKRQKELLANELGVTSQRVLLEYLKIAFADITQYLDFGQKEVAVMSAFGPIKDENGKVLTKKVNHVTLKESDDIDGTLISEVRQSKDGISIKLHDKMKALEVLTKYLDLLPDSHKRRIEEARLDLEKQRTEMKKEELEMRKAENELKAW